MNYLRVWTCECMFSSLGSWQLGQGLHVGDLLYLGILIFVSEGAMENAVLSRQSGKPGEEIPYSYLLHHFLFCLCPDMITEWSHSVSLHHRHLVWCWFCRAANILQNTIAYRWVLRSQPPAFMYNSSFSSFSQQGSSPYQGGRPCASYSTLAVPSKLQNVAAWPHIW